MSETNLLLVKSNLKQLRLPTIHAEFEKLPARRRRPTRLTSNICCA